MTPSNNIFSNCLTLGGGGQDSQLMQIGKQWETETNRKSITISIQIGSWLASMAPYSALPTMNAKV